MHHTLKDAMDHYYEAIVALSESVMKNHAKRPLAEKWQQTPIRLAIKSCYLGNHASQIKSYCGTLSRSHGRSFRIRHDKKLISDSAIKKSADTLAKFTSEKWLWITIVKSWSSFYRLWRFFFNQPLLKILNPPLTLLGLCLLVWQKCIIKYLLIHLLI